MNTTADTTEALIAEFDPTTAGGASQYAARLANMTHDQQCEELGCQIALDANLSRGKPSWMQRMARAACDASHGEF